MRTSRPHLEHLEGRLLPSSFRPLYQDRPLFGPAPAGYSPEAIRRAYGFDQVGYDGGGTTVAVVDAYDDPSAAADLRTFDAQYGLPSPPAFIKVDQRGGQVLPGPDSGWALEIALDVEWAHATAPGASILLVEADSNSGADLFAAVDFARRQPGVMAVSISWGGLEDPSQLAYDSVLATPPGHAGIVFVAASGDTGALAFYPATSPNVISVGGTSLNIDGAGNRVPTPGWGEAEAGWLWSGGGTSAYEPSPPCQALLRREGLAVTRGTPDVAFDGDPYGGVSVYISWLFGAENGWWCLGGTSVGAPCWAGLCAVTDQARRVEARQPPLSSAEALDALYSEPKANFHDITYGFNVGSRIGTDQGTYGGDYFCDPGYDFVTGLGTPIVPCQVAALGNYHAPAAPSACQVDAVLAGVLLRERGACTPSPAAL